MNLIVKYRGQIKAQLANWLLFLVTTGVFSCATPIKSTRPEFGKPQAPRSGKSTPQAPTTNRPSTTVVSNTPLNNQPQPLTSPPKMDPSSQATSNSMLVQEVLARTDLSNLQKLEVLVDISVNSTQMTEQESARNRGIDLVNYKLTVPELQNVANSSSYGYLRGHALYRLAELAIEVKETSLAKTYLNGVIEFMPGSALDFKARETLAQMDMLQNVKPRTIGAVLPLTGKNALMGQRALRGIEMGLGLHLPNSSFRLSIADSEGTQDGARRGVEKLIKEDGAIAIIGSLLSKTAAAVASKAHEYGVPSIALSQKSGITEVGDTVFRNSLTPKMQIQFLVKNAIEKLGMRRFAILYPNDPYGVECTNIFWDEVLARGGVITAAQIYNPQDTDYRFQTQKLVGTYYPEARLEELKIRKKELVKASSVTKKPLRDHYEEDLLSPIIDFDAIFIPDDTKNMGQLAAFLAYSGIKNVKLLGTNLWNSSGLAKRAGNFANSLIFVDSTTQFSPTDENQFSNHGFISEYQSLFNETPGLVEIQAYDSAAILKKLIMEGSTQRDSLLKALSNISQVQGSLGTLVLNEEREFVRPLVLMTLDKNEIAPLIITK